MSLNILVLLDIKRIFRFNYSKKELPFKIVFLILSLLFGCLLFLIGCKLYYNIEVTSNKKPIDVINSILIHWFIFDLVLRYFLQKPPFLNVLPLMLLPVNRKTIVNYYLFKSLISKLNFLPFLIVLPFTIILLINESNFLNILGWFFSFVFISISISYFNLLIKKNEIVLFFIASLLIAVLALDYFGIVLISRYSSKIFSTFFNTPALGLASIFMPIILHIINYKLISRSFYIDSYVQNRKRELIHSKVKWIDKLGNISPFFKIDMKLMLRNTKPKQYALISLTFLLYGLTVFNSEQITSNYPTMLVFTGIIITGGFLFSYGQLIPSWESSYYPMINCHSFRFRDYLESKMLLLYVSVILFFIFSLPYTVCGFFVIKILISSMFFNIGVTVPLTLLVGSLNRKLINLNNKIQIFETNEFSPVQVAFVFIRLALPILVFYPLYKVISFDVGLLFLGFSGITGYIFRQNCLDFIVKVYKKYKYDAIESFSQKE